MTDAQVVAAVVKDNSRREDIIGGLVAVLGAIVVLGTMWMLSKGQLLSTTLAVVQTGAGLALVALGMYVVTPARTKDALDAVGELASDIKPFARRQSDPTPREPTTTVQVPPQTSVNVERPDAPDVHVPSQGPPTEEYDEVDPNEPGGVTDIGNEPELATEITPARRPSPRPAKATPAKVVVPKTRRAAAAQGLYAGRRNYEPGEA